jgi:FAD/FMN-containing dehydrogenase
MVDTVNNKTDPVWVIGDASVPVEEMASYAHEVIEAGRKFGMEINFDAHASAGCLHMRLDLNLRTLEGLRTLELLCKEIMAITIAHGVSTTGEHGEGLARSYFNEQLYGPELHRAFRELKAIFDPPVLLNPGKVVGDITAPWEPSRPG